MNDEDIANIKKVLTGVETELKTMNKSLKIILCCSLLPKYGPNWDYYQSLFSSAERMISKSEGLNTLVKEVLLPFDGICDQSCKDGG